MEINIGPVEARILGAFIEKELTTPDYYPMSLNGLSNACNQKSNRDPVLQLEEPELLEHLDLLRKKGLAMQSQEAGSRVSKYRHTLRERLYLDDQELAILAELLLRGPQTLGELRARADRMAGFADLEKVEEVLAELLDKEPPLVVKLPRQPGRKESRYGQLLTGPLPEPETAPEDPLYAAASKKTIGDLAVEIAALRKEFAGLQEEFSRFRQQFE
jgi:uncharacterized protein YceH (UPF0502 family)